LTRNQGSDLFITADREPSIKLNGRIQPIARNKLTREQAYQVVTSIMNAGQRAEFEKTHECRFAIEAGDFGRFRVSAPMRCG